MIVLFLVQLLSYYVPIIFLFSISQFFLCFVCLFFFLIVYYILVLVFSSVAFFIVFCLYIFCGNIYIYIYIFNIILELALSNVIVLNFVFAFPRGCAVCFVSFSRLKIKCENHVKTTTWQVPLKTERLWSMCVHDPNPTSHRTMQTSSRIGTHHVTASAQFRFGVIETTAKLGYAW